jgi:hypothetical protein
MASQIEYNAEMDESINPMASAWLDAARDLCIRIQHPFTFTADGTNTTTLGVYLPDFGSTSGALLTCRFDGDDVYVAAEKTGYFRSALNPLHYEPYTRERFVETLNDWGWFGPAEDIPPWFTGGIGKHGG